MKCETRMLVAASKLCSRGRSPTADVERDAIGEAGRRDVGLPIPSISGERSVAVKRHPGCAVPSVTSSMPVPAPTTSRCADSATPVAGSPAPWRGAPRTLGGSRGSCVVARGARSAEVVLRGGDFHGAGRILPATARTRIVVAPRYQVCAGCVASRRCPGLQEGADSTRLGSRRNRRRESASHGT